MKLELLCIIMLLSMQVETGVINWKQAVVNHYQKTTTRDNVGSKCKTINEEVCEEFCGGGFCYDVCDTKTRTNCIA